MFCKGIKILTLVAFTFFFSQLKFEKQVKKRHFIRFASDIFEDDFNRVRSKIEGQSGVTFYGVHEKDVSTMFWCYTKPYWISSSYITAKVRLYSKTWHGVTQK
jgi:hypothetical protein